jgi:hypothetical protein
VVRVNVRRRHRDQDYQEYSQQELEVTSRALAQKLAVVPKAYTGIYLYQQLSPAPERYHAVTLLVKVLHFKPSENRI